MSLYPMSNQQISRPANQQISRPANQPINQTSKSAYQTISQSIRPANQQTRLLCRPANQPISKLADQQISKSANQSDQQIIRPNIYINTHLIAMTQHPRQFFDGLVLDQFSFFLSIKSGLYTHTLLYIILCSVRCHNYTRPSQVSH